jgi:hypothetical protein
MLVKVSMPAEPGSAAVRDGRLPKVMGEQMDRLKPEAAYFFAEDGQRTALFVIDMKDPSDIPSVAEPFFTELHAKVDIAPVMNADDLKKGLAKIAPR